VAGLLFANAPNDFPDIVKHVVNALSVVISEVPPTRFPGMSSKIVSESAKVTQGAVNFVTQTQDTNQLRAGVASVVPESVTNELSAYVDRAIQRGNCVL
jgi:hypothetical protein